MTIAAPSPHPLFDPELHYGDGDDNALYNLFTTWPESYFSSLPKPHGNRGVDEPYWELRQSRIFLDDCFRGGRMRRLFTPVVPGPDRLERERLREQATSGDAEQRTRSTVRFRSALDFAQEQAKFDNLLARELAQHCPAPAALRVAPGAIDPSSPPVLPTSPSPPPSREQEDTSTRTGTACQIQRLPVKMPRFLSPTRQSLALPRYRSMLFNSMSTNSRRRMDLVLSDAMAPAAKPGRRDMCFSATGTASLVCQEAQVSAKDDRASVDATVEATSRRVGIRARDVRGIVQEKHRGTHYTRRDIYNARALLRREKLGGLGPTAALIKLFDERGIPYIVKWSATEPDRLVGLLWTFPYCLRMWKRFPETMSFDNTYNTNRFKLPLFQVTGQTCLKSVYNAAFGLIDNERREGFQFLAEAVRELNDRHKIPLPNVVVTDYDQQMKAALESQYPESQQQICVQHINANVLLNAKRKWKSRNEDAESDGDGNPNARLSSGDMEAVLALERQESSLNQSTVTAPVPHNYRGVLELWKFAAFAETKEEHEKAWVRLCGEFNDQQAILMYLYKTYSPIRAQWAQCIIKKYRNFGVRVTSGTEASNNNVKSYLLNRMSHLYSLVEAIEAMLGDQERDFIDNCSQDEVLTSRTYSGPGSEYLGELRTVMSEPGLKLIAKEHRQALRSIPSRSRPWPEPIGDCNEDCSVSWQLGIPCCHTIYNKLEAGIPLTKWDVHPRWHLREPTSHDPYRRIIDPKIAACLRGRPKNATQPVPGSMKIRLSSRCRAAVGKAGPGRKPTGKSAILGPGKQTGVRQAGRRRQPSVRRRRSEWETISDEERQEAQPKRRRQSSRTRPVIAAPPVLSNSGSKESRGDCIHVRM
nr:putative transposase [Epichloe sp. LpTG-3]UUW39107.1 putative transposase [Epichloe sp. LpTG-3]